MLIVPIDNFMFALKAPETQRQYPKRLKIFFDWGIDSNLSLEEQGLIFYKKSKDNLNWASSYFLNFIKYQKEIRAKQNNEITPGTVRNYYKPAKLFCVMNDIILNWDKIAKGLPPQKSIADDRSPKLEEIQNLSKYPDKRIKPIILTMLSSGIRVGAWDELQWKHVTPIYNNKKLLVAAKLVIYPGDKEEYYTFCTPEAYNSLKEWMEFREKSGEKITKDSWVMRDLWQLSNTKKKINKNIILEKIRNPVKLKSSGVKSLIERALYAQKIVETLPEGVKRREFKAAHGFRKYYKSQTEKVMKSINIEMLMGHKIGVSGSYYKPTENELLDNYLLALDLLTIDEENKLRNENLILKQKSKDQDYIINGKLMEKERQIEGLQQSIEKILDTLGDLTNGTEKDVKRKLAKDLIDKGMYVSK